VGTDEDVTVCWSGSSFSHTIVLLTPITILIVDGKKLRDSLFPASKGMITRELPLPRVFELVVTVVVIVVREVKVEVSVVVCVVVVGEVTVDV
jgi:uncharacterized protein YccT (UPF0319 family)